MTDPKLDLSRAVELLERCVDEIDCDIYDDPCTQQLVAWCKEFLSRIRAEATASSTQEDIGPCLGCKRTPCQCDQPPLRTRAKEVSGWKLGDEYPGYVEYSRGNQEVSFDGSEIEARETVSGYEGWTAVVRIPIALLRELLPTLPRAELTDSDRAYTERNRLVAALARHYPSGLKPTAIEGWDPCWHGCVFVDTPTGQMSWHYHDRDADLFAGLPPYDKPWDGHTTPEKYERLSRLRPRAELTGEERAFLANRPCCADCGLSDAKEPSVGERFPSGIVRCNDCARRAARKEPKP